MAVSAAPDGKINEILEIQDTSTNNTYWYSSVFTKTKVVGDYRYTMKNNMGPLNLFAASYSQLVFVNNGENRIIYDVNSQQLVKYILIFIGVVLFSLCVVLLVVKEIKQLRTKKVIQTE